MIFDFFVKHEVFDRPQPVHVSFGNGKEYVTIAAGVTHVLAYDVDNDRANYSVAVCGINDSFSKEIGRAEAISKVMRRAYRIPLEPNEDWKDNAEALALLVKYSTKVIRDPKTVSAERKALKDKVKQQFASHGALFAENKNK